MCGRQHLRGSAARFGCAALDVRDTRLDLRGSFRGALHVSGNFLGGSALLFHGGRNRRRNFRYPGNGRADLLDRRDRILGRRLDVGDLLADFVGGFRSLLGERLHFRRDNRKSPAGFAGARGFDGRVQRQKIGLSGNGLNQIDNIPDATGGLRQLADARVGLLGLFDRLTCDASGSIDLAADFADRGCQLLARRRNRMDVRGSLSRSVRCALADLLDGIRGFGQGRGRRLELAGSRGDQRDDLTDFAFKLVGETVHVDLALLGLAQLSCRLLLAQTVGFDHGVAKHLYGAGHLTDFVAALGIGDGRVELAGTERSHALFQARQRFYHAPRDRPGDRNRGQHQHDNCNRSGPNHRPERRIHVGNILCVSDHQVPGRETAGEGDLVERGGIRAASKERIAQAALPVTREIHQHGCEGKTIGVLDAAHVLAEQGRNAGIGDADAGLVVVNVNEIGMLFIPDETGGSEEPLLRFLFRHLAASCGVRKAVGHLPDGVDDRMRLLGALGDELVAGDPQYGGCDQRHADGADDRHGGELGADRAI